MILKHEDGQDRESPGRKLLTPRNRIKISKSGWRSTEFLRVRSGWGEVSFRPGGTATGFRSALGMVGIWLGLSIRVGNREHESLNPCRFVVVVKNGSGNGH